MNINIDRKLNYVCNHDTLLVSWTTSDSRQADFEAHHAIPWSLFSLIGMEMGKFIINCCMWLPEFYLCQVRRLIFYEIQKSQHKHISGKGLLLLKLLRLLWLQLTHWGQDKMATISQTTFSNAFSWIKMHEFCLRFQQSLFLRFAFNNIPALVQIMAWRHPDDKALSEPMMVS